MAEKFLKYDMHKQREENTEVNRKTMVIFFPKSQTTTIVDS